MTTVKDVQKMKRNFQIGQFTMGTNHEEIMILLKGGDNGKSHYLLSFIF